MLLSLAANYLGEARRRVPIAIAALVVDVVLALILVPTMGIVGAAIATSVAYAVYVPGHLWICYRLLALPIRPILMTLVRSAAAAAVMCVVLAAFGTSGLGPVVWVAASIAGTAAYAAVLVITREFSRADFAAVAAALARVRR